MALENRRPTPRTLASDKNLEAIAPVAMEIGDEYIFTRADSVRSIEPEALRDRFGSGILVESPMEALELALQRNQSVVIAGSIYLAGIVRRRLRHLELTES